jgi:hypothetical protein
MFISLKVPRQCPLVLLVKVRWKRGKAIGSEGGATGGGQLGVCSRRKSVLSL